nr:methyltransferase domain-containing protein [Paracoccaceae bacterium]
SIRSLFSDCDYTGTDVAGGAGVDHVVAGGAGVDHVVAGQLADYPTGAFDAVISCECLEHNPWWRETLANMFRMTREGGLVITTCAGPGRPEHGTTRTNPKLSPHTVGWDYYDNVSPKSIRRALPLDLWFDDHILGSDWNIHDTHLIGLRTPSPLSLDGLRSRTRVLTRPQGRRARMNWLGWHIAGEFGSGVVRNLSRRLA